MFSALGREALQIVLPSWCVVCDEPLPWRGRVGSCCERCWSSLPKIGVSKCVSCALPLAIEEASGERCLECQVEPLPVEWCDAWGQYRGAMERLLHAFKFRRHDFLAEPLAALVAETVREHNDAFDAVAAVPMHRAKLRQRGYNQAELLAVELARRIGVPFGRKLLEKTGERETQSTLHRDRRAANVRGVFRARGSVPPSVLLVDDITTTGATLRECARVLLDAGAKRVCAVTLAKVSA